MALFVLKHGYRVNTTEKGGSVVHIRTGDALELNALELHVLARSTAGGVDASDERVRAIVKKLTNLGLLVKAPAQAARTVPTFDELTLDVDKALADVKAPASPPPAGPLPRFRGGLKVVTHPETGLCDIIDAATMQTLSVHDFEMSLARLLDGKRSYADVFTAAQRLGIPVTPESLLQFIKQLTVIGFMAPPGSTEAGPGSSFPAREKWNSSVRMNFQAGLKLRREGRYAEAITAFELVLISDPENPEAKDALAAVRRTQAEAQAAAVPNPVEKPEPATKPVSAAAPAAPVASSQSVFELDVSSFAANASTAAARKPEATEQASTAAGSAIEDSRLAEGAPRRSVLQQGNPAGGLALEESMLLEVASRRSVSLPVYVVSIVVAAAVGWFAATQLGAQGPGAGAEAALPPAAADAAPAGAAEPPSLAAVTPHAAEPLVPARQANDTQNDAGAMMVSPLDGGSPRPFLVPEQSADAGLLHADAAPLRAEAGPPRTDAGPMAEVPGAEPAASWTLARIIKRGRVTMESIEANADGAPKWSAEKGAEAKRGTVLGSLVTASGRVELVAHKAGLFMPSIDDGQAAKSSEVLALIVYTQSFIQATVDMAKVPAAWECEVADKATGQTAPCAVVTASPRAKGLSLTATTDPLWFDTCAKPELRLREASAGPR